MRWERYLIAALALPVAVALYLAWSTFPIIDSGISTTTTVGSYAELRALVHGRFSTAYRTGFAIPGDGGAATYVWNASACSLNDGAGDNGYQVVPTTGGGCWTLVVPSVIDARVWGCALDGVTDDTVCWRAIDLAWKAMPRPPQYVFLAGNSAVGMSAGGPGNCLKNITRISGNIASSAFSLAPGQTGPALCYIGSGPFELDHVTFKMPPPNWAAKTTSHSSSVMIRGDLVPGNVHAVVGIKIHDNIFTGGFHAVSLRNVRQAEVYNNWAIQIGGAGFVADTSGDTPLMSTTDISIHDNSCLITGHYCVSFSNQTQTAAAPRRLYVVNNHAVGSGVLFDKGCYDLTANSYEYLVADNSGVDCLGGGGEAKMSYARGIPVVPSSVRGSFVKMRYLTHFDAGFGFGIISETPTAASSDAHAQIFATIHAAYAPAPPWQASWRYQLGDTVTNAGGVYLAVVSGIGSGSGGPSGKGHAVIDGSITWIYLAAEPAAQGVVSATASGGATGSGYSPNDYLRVSNAACEVPPVLQPNQVQSGIILDYRVAFEGHCTSTPTNPVVLIGGAGTGAKANLTLMPNANRFTAAWIEAVTDARIEVHAERTRDGVFLNPRGSNDQTIRRTIISIEGTVQHSCVVDGVPGGNWFKDGADIVQNGAIIDVTILPHCTALGQASGAIEIGTTAPLPAWQANKPYFQNALVVNGDNIYIARCPSHAGCTSATSAGPSRIGTDITDGNSGLTWTSYGVRKVAALDYYNFRIAGGFLVNQRMAGGSYAIFQRGAEGSFLGEIYGTRMLAGTGGILIKQPTVLAVGGGSSLNISGNAEGKLNSAPIEGVGVAATGRVAINSTMEITAPTTLQAWRNINGGTITVDGMIVRGTQSSAPAAPCNYGESWLNSRPSAAVPFGWTCTNPGTSRGVDNFTAR